MQQDHEEQLQSERDYYNQRIKEQTERMEN